MKKQVQKKASFQYHRCMYVCMYVFMCICVTYRMYVSEY